MGRGVGGWSNRSGGTQEAKGLFTIGWIVTHPNGSSEPTPVELRHHAGFQAMLPECVVGVMATKSRQDHNFARFYALSDPGGLGYVLRHSDRVRVGAATEVPSGFRGAGKPLFEVAEHVQCVPESNDKHKFKVRKKKCCRSILQEKKTRLVCGCSVHRLSWPVQPIH